MDKKDTFYSKLSLVLGLGFWIPLLNVPLSILAITFGIISLRLIHLYPKRYGGRTYAVLGIILGSISIIFLVSAFLIPASRERMINAFLFNRTSVS